MNLTEVLETIQKKITKTTEWDSPEFLSNLLLELASYYSTLGEFVASSEQEADYAETHYKVTEAELVMGSIAEGMAVGKAETEARVHSREDRQLHIDKKHKARLLFLTRQNLAVTMDAIRSRLSYIKSDREGAKHAV